MDDLERSLRQHLESAELVCDAQIPDDLVDAAEAVIRPICNSLAMDRVHEKRPAALVTYFAIRGSERYEFNGLWPQLGVTTKSSRAGQAFLRSLQRLNLPTFQDEVAAVKARTYVAPVLMHGAFPADVAHHFVERVERELRVGLVSAAEARQRLLRDPEIVHSIRRPASRLLEWAPEYAERLLDSVIAYIEDPGGGALAQLPFHLQQALTTNADRRRGLKRLRPPTAIFELWTGYGPEVVASGDGEPWTLTTALRSELLGDDDRVELVPDAEAVVEREGRRVVVFERGPAWVFGLDGRVVPSKSSVPQQCVVLLPHGSQVSSNGAGVVHEVEYGVPLSGSWSAYRSVEVSMSQVTELAVSHADGRRQHWRVGSSPVALVGEPVAGVLDAAGQPVHSSVPSLRVSQIGDDAVTLWFDSGNGEHRHDRQQPDPRGLIDLAKVVGRLPATGRLTARLPDGSRESWALTVVPGLTVGVPQAPLGPGDPASVEYGWDACAELVDVDIVPPATTVALSIDGLADGAVNVTVPRVQWGLRADGVGRLDLAPGAIQTEVGELIDRARWLVVRCGQPAQIGMRLLIDGVERQRVPSAGSRSSGGLHHRSFDLQSLRDTLRSHRESSVRIEIDVDDVRLAAVECGGVAVTAPRSWTVSPVTRSRRDDGALWRDVPWLRGVHRGGSQLPMADPDRVDELELRLRLDGDAGAIVTFLRVLGARVQRWKLTEFPAGDSAADWAVMNAVADRLWRTDGERLRLFSGDELDRRLGSWARTWRDRYRRASVQERSEFDMWLIGRIPPIDRLEGWRNKEWLAITLPPSAGPSAQWIPAAVLYACLATAGGDDDAGPVVVAAARHQPQLLLEIVAFMLQACRKGHRFHVPVLAALPEEPDPTADTDSEDVDMVDDAGVGPGVVLSSLTLSEVNISVDAGVIRVEPAAGVASPVLRLGQNGRVEAILPMQLDDDSLIASPPGDLDGTFTVQFQVGHELLSRIGDGVTIELERRKWSPPLFPVTSRHMRDLTEMHTYSLVERVAAAVRADRLRDAPIEELFDDERAAGSALLAYARGREADLLDRIAIAIAPSALLFSQLCDLPESQWLVATSPLLYAVITTRDRHTWRPLGWPANIDLTQRPSTIDALAGWVRGLAGAVVKIEAPTYRYAMSSQISGHELFARAITLLERRDVDESFIDLMVAMHRQLAFDHVTPEATRLLLTAYDTNPSATRAAVLAGIAVFTILNDY